MINKDLLRAARGLRRKGSFQRGLLGNGAGAVKVDGRPGYFYVRVEKPGGYEEGIFPGRVPPYYNLPVRIETHPITAVQFVAGIDNGMLAYSGTDPAEVPDTTPHAWTHEYGGPDMLAWIHTSQIFPMRAQAHESDPQSVTVQGGNYFSEGQFCVQSSPQDIDLSTYFPTSGRKYILLYIDSNGDLDVQDDDASMLADLGPAPAGMFWIAAIRLMGSGEIGWQDIVDLRFMNSGVVNGGEMEMGTDYIVVGNDHPSISGRWTRMGSQIDDLMDTSEASGITAYTETDFAFFGIDDEGTDEARASIIWGDNTDDKLWFSWYSMTGSKYEVGDLDSEGQLRLASLEGTGERMLVPSDDGTIIAIPRTAGGGGSATGAVGAIHRWHVDGPLATANEIDGIWVTPNTQTYSRVWLYLRDSGSAGNTTVALEYSESGGTTWNAITTITIAHDGGHVAITDITQRVYAGSLLRINITAVAIGSRGLTAQIGLTEAGTAEHMPLLGVA